MSTHNSITFIERLFPYNHNIGHDDPNAEKLLKEKLTALQAKQEMFKAINAINRKKLTTQEKVGQLVNLLANAMCVVSNEFDQPNKDLMEKAIGLLQPDYAGRTGIPSYELTNNNGVINSVYDRLVKLKRVEAMPEFDETKNDVRIWIDKDENRIFVEFSGKPEQEVISHLKSYGFRWRPSEKVWSGNIDKYRLERAKKVWDMVPQHEMPSLQEMTEENPDMSALDMIRLLEGEDHPEALVTPQQLPFQLAAVERLM